MELIDKVKEAKQKYNNLIFANELNTIYQAAQGDIMMVSAYSACYGYAKALEMKSGALSEVLRQMDAPKLWKVYLYAMKVLEGKE